MTAETDQPELRALVTARFQQSMSVPETFFAAEEERIAYACWEMARRFHQGGRLLAFGNGASATDAQHVSVEFVHPIIVGKRALPAIALTNDAATVSRGPIYRARESPDRARDLPDRARDLPDRARDLPDRARDLPDRARDLPDRVRVSPDRARDLPDRAPDHARVSPDRARVSPDRARDLPDRAPDHARVSPDNTQDTPFVHQIKVLARPQDIAMGFTLDGNCTNVVAALETARHIGLLTLGMGGGDGGLLRNSEIDFPFIVHSNDPMAIQETHETLYHVLWELVHIFFEHEGLLT